MSAKKWVFRIGGLVIVVAVVSALFFGGRANHAEYVKGYAAGYMAGTSTRTTVLDDGSVNLKTVPVDRSDNPTEMVLFRGGKGEYWWASSLWEYRVTSEDWVPAGIDTLYIRWQY